MDNPSSDERDGSENYNPSIASILLSMQFVKSENKYDESLVSEINQSDILRTLGESNRQSAGNTNNSNTRTEPGSKDELSHSSRSSVDRFRMEHESMMNAIENSKSFMNPMVDDTRSWNGSISGVMDLNTNMLMNSAFQDALNIIDDFIDLLNHNNQISGNKLRCIWFRTAERVVASGSVLYRVFATLLLVEARNNIELDRKITLFMQRISLFKKSSNEMSRSGESREDELCHSLQFAFFIISGIPNSTSALASTPLPSPASLHPSSGLSALTSPSSSSASSSSEQAFFDLMRSSKQPQNFSTDNRSRFMKDDLDDKSRNVNIDTNIDSLISTSSAVPSSDGDSAQRAGTNPSLGKPTSGSHPLSGLYSFPHMFGAPNTPSMPASSSNPFNSFSSFPSYSPFGQFNPFNPYGSMSPGARMNPQNNNLGSSAAMAAFQQEAAAMRNASSGINGGMPSSSFSTFPTWMQDMINVQNPFFMNQSMNPLGSSLNNGSSIKSKNPTIPTMSGITTNGMNNLNPNGNPMHQIMMNNYYSNMFSSLSSTNFSMSKDRERERLNSNTTPNLNSTKIPNQPSISNVSHSNPLASYLNSLNYSNHSSSHSNPNISINVNSGSSSSNQLSSAIGSSQTSSTTSPALESRKRPILEKVSTSISESPLPVSFNHGSRPAVSAASRGSLAALHKLHREIAKDSSSSSLSGPSTSASYSYSSSIDSGFDGNNHEDSSNRMDGSDTDSEGDASPSFSSCHNNFSGKNPGAMFSNSNSLSMSSGMMGDISTSPTGLSPALNGFNLQSPREKKSGNMMFNAMNGAYSGIHNNMMSNMNSSNISGVVNSSNNNGRKTIASPLIGSSSPGSSYQDPNDLVRRKRIKYIESPIGTGRAIAPKGVYPLNSGGYRVQLNQIKASSKKFSRNLTDYKEAVFLYEIAILLIDHITHLSTLLQRGNYSSLLSMNSEKLKPQEAESALIVFDGIVMDCSNSSPYLPSGLVGQNKTSPLLADDGSISSSPVASSTSLSLIVPPSSPSSSASTPSPSSPSSRPCWPPLYDIPHGFSLPPFNSTLRQSGHSCRELALSAKDYLLYCNYCSNTNSHHGNNSNRSVGNLASSTNRMISSPREATRNLPTSPVIGSPSKSSSNFPMFPHITQPGFSWDGKIESNGPYHSLDTDDNKNSLINAPVPLPLVKEELYNTDNPRHSSTTKPIDISSGSIHMTSTMTNNSFSPAIGTSSLSSIESCESDNLNTKSEPFVAESPSSFSYNLPAASETNFLSLPSSASKISSISSMTASP